jgi:hypothetical protein
MQSLDGQIRPRSRSGVSRLWRFLYVLYSLEVGVFLLFLPWQNMWDNNYLIYMYPSIRPIVANPFLKGGVLGLGILNILIGIQEIARFLKSFKRQPS